MGTLLDPLRVPRPTTYTLFRYVNLSFHKLEFLQEIFTRSIVRNKPYNYKIELQNSLKRICNIFSPTGHCLRPTCRPRERFLPVA